MKKKFASPKKAVSDVIRSAYSRISPISVRPYPPKAIRSMIVSMTAQGLGDCIMLTDIVEQGIKEHRIIHAWSYSPHFPAVFSFHPSYKVHGNDCGIVNPFLVDILRLREVYDLGNGHQIQQLRRAWGLQVDMLPKGVMVRKGVEKKNRVILHFEPSKRNVTWQRQYWHPRMRELYPESQLEIEKFIRAHPELEFIEVGHTPVGIKGARHIYTTSSEDLIELVQSGAWFIGIMSGPMHVAAAVGIRSIVVVNYPRAQQIVLPCLRRTGTPEEEWMYPQNVHLHQEGDSALVPKISKDSLEAAFNGDVYPFWMDDWLPMIKDF